MLFDYRSKILVAVHTAADPSPEEWSRYCSAIERQRHEMRGTVVYTLGGGPSSRQRQEMRVAFHETPMAPVAILTRSAIVRGIITSINWFQGNQLVAFDPNDVDRALQYVGSQGAVIDRGEIIEMLSALAHELNIPAPPSFAQPTKRAAGA